MSSCGGNRRKVQLPVVSPRLNGMVLVTMVVVIFGFLKVLVISVNCHMYLRWEEFVFHIIRCQSHDNTAQQMLTLCVFTNSLIQIYVELCLNKYILLMSPHIIKTYVQLLFNRFTTKIKQIAVCQALLTVESCANIPHDFMDLVW